MMRLNIIGFGNQAKAWAFNLRDSQFDFSISLRPKSHSRSVVSKESFRLVDQNTTDFYSHTHYALLIPDEEHLSFIETHAKNLKAGISFIYAHGYSLIKNQLHLKFPQFNHILLAPKTIGTELRNQYLIKGEIGGVFSAQYCSPESKIFEMENILKISRCLGINLGPYETTFENEVTADLYSEQGILCSIIPYTAELMFKNLISKGIEPELAYLECWHELKLIVSAMIEYGPQKFFNLISPNALIGSEVGREKLIDKNFKENLSALLNNIETKTFFDHVDQTKTDELRKNINDFWANSELTKTHQKMRMKNE